MPTVREEFQLKKFGFSGVYAERFYISQWRAPGFAYLLYRVLLAIYCLVILAYTANRQVNYHNEALQKWAAYLTNWTYFTLTLYFAVHAVVVVCQFTMCRNRRLMFGSRIDRTEHVNLFNEFLYTGIDSEPDTDRMEAVPLSAEVIVFESPTRWPLNLVWILFSVASTSSFMVSLVFWAVLVPTAKGNGLAELNHDNIQLHLVNSILILLELCVTAVPVRLLHFIYPLTYGIVYMFFSVFYWVDDHSHIMYNILDWNIPGPTTGYCLAVGFVLIPILQAVVYFIHRLKCCIFAHIYNL